MTYASRPKMNYDQVLSNTTFTILCQVQLWLVRHGGAMHVGTNRDATSLQIKVYGVEYQQRTFWINSAEEVDQVLKELETYVREGLRRKSPQ